MKLLILQLIAPCTTTLSFSSSPSLNLVQEFCNAPLCKARRRQKAWRLAAHERRSYFGNFDVNALVRGAGLTPVVDKTNKKTAKQISPGNGKQTPQKHSKTTKKSKSKSKKMNQNQAQTSKQEESLNSVSRLSLTIQLQYAQHGHAVLREFLPSTYLTTLLHNHLHPYCQTQSLQAWRQKVIVASSHFPSKQEQDTLLQSCQTVESCRQALQTLGVPPSTLPFLQYFNTWRSLPAISTLCTSTKLAHAAATLMNVKSVRLYQDAIFWKAKGHDWTPWHVDAKMAPFDTSNMITFWIPLQPVEGSTGTGLVFVSGSHADIALPYWNKAADQEGVYEGLEERYGGADAIHHYMPLALGDVTVHSGWTLHCADPNRDGPDRYALAVTYVDARAQVREDVLEGRRGAQERHSAGSNGTGGNGLGDDEDSCSFEAWIGEVKAREWLDHPLLPIVWPK